MAEDAFRDGGTVVPGETRCSRWPSSCAEAQAQAMTCFRFCDFCLYGPPAEPPTREDGNSLSMAEARERIEKVESQIGEKLRKAVIALVGERAGDA